MGCAVQACVWMKRAVCVCSHNDRLNLLRSLLITEGGNSRSSEGAN